MTHDHASRSLKPRTRRALIALGIFAIFLAPALLTAHAQTITPSLVSLSGDEVKLRGVEFAHVTVTTTPYAIGEAEVLVDVDATGGARTVTLPSTTNQPGRYLIITNTATTGNVVTVSGTVDGAVNRLLGPRESVILYPSGSGWRTSPEATMQASVTISQVDSTYVVRTADGKLYAASTSASAAIRSGVNATPTGGSLFLHPSMSGAAVTADVDVTAETGQSTSLAVAKVAKSLSILGQGTKLNLTTGHTATYVMGFLLDAPDAHFVVSGLHWYANGKSQTSTYTPLVWPERHKTMVVSNNYANETRWLIYGDSAPCDGTCAANKANEVKRFHAVVDNIVDNTGAGTGSFGGIALHNQLGYSIVRGNQIRGGNNGIFIDTAWATLVQNNVIEFQFAYGIQVYDGSSDVRVEGNIIAGQPTSGNRSGIKIGSGTVNGGNHRVVVKDNTIFNRQNGIVFEVGTGLAAYNTLVEGNRIFNVTRAIIDDSTLSSGTVYRRNLGLTSEAWVTGTVAEGATSASVSHTLWKTPARVLCTPTNDHGSRWWVDTKAVTTFAIKLQSAAPAGGASFECYAET